MDCAEIYPSCVMDFDHVRGVKRFSVGQMTNCPASTIETEIAKCDVVCANCHRIRTYTREILAQAERMVHRVEK